MEGFIKLQGIIVNEPEYIPPHTVFTLRAQEQIYRITRSDLVWQRRDVVFLRRGQTVEVSGSVLPGEERTVLAGKILLTGLQTKK